MIFSFKTLAKVFEQTYTRFLDLQKAKRRQEKNTDRSRLERVPKQEYGHTQNDELHEAGEILLVEIQKLGIENLPPVMF